MRVILNGEHAMNCTRLHELTLRVMNCSKLRELPYGHDIRCNSIHGATREIMAKPIHDPSASIHL